MSCSEINPTRGEYQHSLLVLPFALGKKDTIVTWEASSLNNVITQQNKSLDSKYRKTQQEPSFWSAHADRNHTLLKSEVNLPTAQGGTAFTGGTVLILIHVVLPGTAFHSHPTTKKPHVHRLFSCKMGSGTAPEYSPASPVDKRIVKTLCLHAVFHVFPTSKQLRKPSPYDS